MVKPSKNNHEETSYRPIPLITCIQQIFNTIIKNRMEWICDKKEVIPDTQYGFRKSRGYNDYLLNFIIVVYSALTFKESIMVGSLNLSKSNEYDRVHLPTLVDKMVSDMVYQLNISDIAINS